LQEVISALGINPGRITGDAELTEFLPASLSYLAEVNKISADAQAHAPFLAIAASYQIQSTRTRFPVL